MKKINLLYIVAILLGISIYFLTSSMKAEAVFFYGFAENKETEINHIEDVLVEKIMVTNGQEVKKGDLLVIVKDAAVSTKIEGLELEKNAVTIDSKQREIQIRNEIVRIELKRDEELNQLNGDITELQKKIQVNTEMFEGLKSINKGEQIDLSPDQIKLNELMKRKEMVSSNSEKKIDLQRRVLARISSPSEIKNDQLDSELNYYNKIKDKLSIYAPSDGLIGTITCKEGENKSAFSTLMNFYKPNPIQVKGYVHESQLLEVKVGDNLEIISTLHADRKVIGEVIGLGSRIVEIPERLRKMPEFKTYGREVLIRIPENNRFLQKEKVMLNAAPSGEKGALSNMFSFKSKEDENPTANSSKE